MQTRYQRAFPALLRPVATCRFRCDGSETCRGPAVSFVGCGVVRYAVYPMKTLRLLDHLAAKPIIWLVRVYQLVLSPWIGQQCRFHPTCSAYSLSALQEHGACKGTAYMIWRILRCNPWSAGGLDPVPCAGVLEKTTVANK